MECTLQTVNVDGYIFKVTFDHRTGLPSNAFNLRAGLRIRKYNVYSK